MFAWGFRSLMLVLLGVIGWVGQDVVETLDRVDGRVRDLEVRMAARYITREEARVMIDALETRLMRRMDREIPLPSHPGLRP